MNVSLNKNDKKEAKQNAKKKSTKKKVEIEEKDSSESDEDDDEDENEESSDEEEEERVKTPKKKSPKKTNKTTPKRQISTSISSSSSSTLSDENSSEKISKLSEDNTNEDSTSSSTGSLKSKNSQSSSLSFNINNILSKPQGNLEVQSQMMPPPSPSNGSTSSTASSNLVKHPNNVPSPSNSTSSSSSSPALQQQQQQQTSNFHKPNIINNNMQYQMWKTQNPMYPPQGMFPPPNDPNFYAYHQQQMMTKTMSPSSNVEQERPPSTKTPQNDFQENNRKLQQTPTTPQNLTLTNSQTPRSPIVNLNNSQMASSSQHGFTDNSNMSFTQDHDDEASMMSDEMSSPKLSNSQTHGHTAKSLQHNAEVLAKLIEMGKETNDDTPERKDFVQKLQKIWEDNAIMCRSLPTVNKHILDLYKFYCLVRQKGGFSDVNKNKSWKDISSSLDMGNTAPIALTLKRKYASIGLVHYECKYDLNGADPLPLIADIEKASVKAKKQADGSQLTSSNSNSNLSAASSITPAKKSKKSNGKDKKEKGSSETPSQGNTPNPAQTTPPSIQYPNQQTSQQPPQPPTLQQQPQQPQMMPPQVNNPQMNPHFAQNEFQQNQMMNHGYQQMPNQQQQYYGQPRPPYPYQYPGQQNMMRYPMPVQQAPVQQPSSQALQNQMPNQAQPNQTVQPQAGQMMPPPPVQQMHPQMQYQMQQPFNGQIPPQMTQQMPQSIPQAMSQTMPQQYPPQIQTQYPPGQPPMPAQQTIQQPLQQSLQQSLQQPLQQSPIAQQVVNPNLQRPMQEQNMSPAPQAPIQQQTPQQPPLQNPQTSILSSKLSNSSSPSPLMSLNQMNQNLGPSNLQLTGQQGLPPNPQLPPHLQQINNRPINNMPPHHPAQQMPPNQQYHTAHPNIQPQPQQQQTAQQHPPHLSTHPQVSSHLAPPPPPPSQHMQFHPQINPNVPNQPLMNQMQAQHVMHQQKHMMNINQPQQQHQIQQVQNNQFAQVKLREPQFPVDSVESTVPVESKKRKICAKDIGPCDPWKLYMSLKSGLLAESTWALDALNILLYDDQTISFFHLSHFPGLVNTLLEHFLKCLKLIFDEFKDLNIVQYPFKKENESDEEEDVDEEHKGKLNGFHIDSIMSDKKTKDNQVLKVNFSDKDVRNRFTHYYSNKNKIVKFNDSRANIEWLEYNQPLLEKYCNGVTNKKRKLKKSKSNNLDNFIQTSFNSNHEWDDFEKKLFFGNFYSHFKNDKIENTTKNMSKLETCRTIENDQDPNYEFIKRHKNREPSDLEHKIDDQAVQDDDSLFKIVSQRNQELMNRCSIISTIIRNLSFVPGNDVELCKSNLLIDVLSRLLILKHEHKLIVNIDDSVDDTNYKEFCFLNDQLDCIKAYKDKNFIYKDISRVDGDTETKSRNEWWWECVQLLRENTLVTLANISGALNLNNLDENIIEIYSHGLIHWIVCKSNEALDPLSTTSETNMLSPQRLSIEILSKLSINDINIDLVCANLNKMRPFMDAFIHVLCSEYLTKRDEQTQREFSIVLLNALAKSDQFTSRSIAKYTSCFLSFIEDFEEIARRFQLLNPSHLHYHPNFIQSSHHNGNNPNLRVLNEDISNINEENLGTTIDMLRRCSNALAYLSVYSENVPFILKYENRILDLVTSQFVDFKVAQILSEVLFNCSKNS